MRIQSAIIAKGLFAIDSRYIVRSKSDLYNANTWFEKNDQGLITKNWTLYKGMQVAIAARGTSDEDGELYICVDAAKPSKDEHGDYLPIPKDHWRKISPIEWNDEIEPISAESEETQEEPSDDPNSGDQPE